MTCAECPKAFTEEWSSKQSVLRCGAEGTRKGYVTELFPTGHIGVVSGRDAPVWCPMDQNHK